ncbi:MAG: MFS transporter [Acidobacteriaceae bacterium]|jgi:ACS family hexuronate transporter-like MFS transporter
MRSGSRPWFFVALVTVAIGISYFDRQALPVAISAIQRNIPISNAQFALLQAAFLATYALLYAGGGKFLDTVGTKVGFAVSMTWWSVACALHGFAHGLALLVLARLLLGMGEGAAFPAATRVIAEWLPATERATAMGIINAGTALGSVLAPPLIGLILLLGSWRYIFFFAASLGLAWAASWLLIYRQPPELALHGIAGAVATIPWLRLLSSGRVLGLVGAKFLSDSAWFFCLFWLPKYLYDARGFDVKQVSYFAWIPYASSGLGSFAGGWFSSRLLRRGHSLNFSRKLPLGLSAALMPAVILVPHVSVSFALLLFSIAFFGQQSWSGLIMTLPTDVFPLGSVGSVAGLIGFGGAMGGAIFNLAAGQLLTYGAGYGTLFAVVGSLHAVAFAILLLTSGVLHPPATNKFQEREKLVSS